MERTIENVKFDVTVFAKGECYIHPSGILEVRNIEGDKVVAAIYDGRNYGETKKYNAGVLKNFINSMTDDTKMDSISRVETEEVAKRTEWANRETEMKKACEFLAKYGTLEASVPKKAFAAFDKAFLKAKGTALEDEDKTRSKGYTVDSSENRWWYRINIKFKSNIPGADDTIKALERHENLNARINDSNSVEFGCTTFGFELLKRGFNLGNNHEYVAEN